MRLIECYHNTVWMAGLAAAVFLGLISVLPTRAASISEDNSVTDEDAAWEAQGSQTTVIYMPEDYDLGYEGLLDQRTGGVPENAENDNIIMITENMGFDTEQRMYVNYVQGDKSKWYYSSLPNGIITNGSISFQMGTRHQYVLYRSGDRVTDADIYNIVQEGAYVMETYGQGSSDGDRFAFTIIQSVTNSMEWFEIPEGFNYISVIINDEQAAAPSGTSSQMPSDGTYIYEFGCDKIGLSYRVQIEKDTVAPRLALQGVMGDLARGPVTMTRLGEEESVIEIVRDGQPVNVPYNLTLEDYGEYKVTIRDMAGNSSEYRFTIQMYFTMTSMLVFLLLIMIVAGLGGYFQYVKSHLRVR